MKNLCLLNAIILISALPALGQNTSYRFDNFDFDNGVRIELPPPSENNPKQNPRSRKLKPTSLAYSHASSPLDRLKGLDLSTSLKGYTTGDQNIDNLILESGKRNSVDPLLIYAVMHQESTFKKFALSPKGARGLMQLMPPTAKRFGVTSIFDPKQNIEGGARYLRFLLDYFDGDIKLALAGYNAGEGAVMKFGYRVPPYRETQEYVRRIGNRYSLMRDPLTARQANGPTPEQFAALRQKESTPLTVYERSVFAVKLPDGRLQLVSQ